MPGVAVEAQPTAVLQKLGVKPRPQCLIQRKDLNRGPMHLNVHAVPRRQRQRQPFLRRIHHIQRLNLVISLQKLYHHETRLVERILFYSLISKCAPSIEQMEVNTRPKQTLGPPEKGMNCQPSFLPSQRLGLNSSASSPQISCRRCIT